MAHLGLRELCSSSRSEGVVAHPGLRELCGSSRPEGVVWLI